MRSGVDLGAIERADVGAVAQHGDAIAEPEHLGQPVRDIEQRRPALLQLLEHREQMVRFRIGQRRRRLVEDEDAAVERERAGDLQELAVRGRERFRASVGVDRQVQLVEERARARAHLALAQPSAAHDLAARRRCCP